MKIKHVYGNVLKLDIPLTIKIRTMEGDVPTEREEPFYPDISKGCAVILGSSYNRKIQYEATVSGNVAHIEDDGIIGIGTYKVTVKCYDEYGNPYRYMVRDIIEICDATADAGIEAGVEFNAETYTLEGAVFVSYGGGSFEQVQADWAEADIHSKAYIKNKPTNLVEDESYVHTDNNYTNTEKEKLAELENYDDSGIRQELDGKVDKINGKGLSTNDYTNEDKQKVDSALQSETDPTVPQWAKQPSKPSYTAQDVGALPNNTKYGSTIDLTMNSTTYVLTLSLKDQDGTVLNTKTVDLPIESVVVNGRYDAANKKIVLTLQSGSTIDVPVGDLIAGLQAEITSVNMLDADLVDDTNSTHKFVTAQEKTTWNNKSDFSGSYNDLTDKPSIPAAQIQADWNQSDNSAADYIKNKPTNVSAFTNDSGYITKTVNDLVNYYLKSDTYTKTEVQQLISAIQQFTYQVVSSLPTASADTMNIIYLVPSADPKTQNVKDEYITIDNGVSATTRYTWEQIGSTAIDLSGYYTSQQTDAAITAALNTSLANYTTTADLTTLLAVKANAADLATVATSGSYSDLSDKPTIPAAQVNSDWNASSGVAEILHKPTIPTKVSDLTNDAGYTTNTGTITSVKMNGSTIASSGEVDLGTVITSHQDISGKANKSEMSVVDSTGTDADKTTITLKTGTSATVLKSHQSLSGKQDVIDSSHKLSADLVDDTNTTNKFTNAAEKQTWNAKQDALTFNTTPSSSNKVATMADVPTVPNNLVVFSNDNGEGIVPTDGIRAEQVNAGATISVNADMVTVVSGNVGTSAITLQVPNDNLAHVWDIFMTTDSTVAITFAMSNSATILYPNGFAVGASKAIEISVIGVGTKYYLRYGEFA